MTASRDLILASIRRSLGVGGGELTRSHAVEERLERAPKGVVPARGQGDSAHRLALFRSMAEAVFATVESVASAAEVPAAVARYLRDQNLPPSLRRGDDPRLAAMPWDRTTLDIATGPTTGHDLNGLSHALAGVAETGTLVLASGADNPSTLNFLPDNHIVVIEARDIVADYETMWSKVRRAFGKGSMPRTLNWITGPSRSADIEQTILLGAHGPRRLHIVVVEA